MLYLTNSSLNPTNIHTKCGNLLTPLTFHLYARSHTKGEQGYPFCWNSSDRLFLYAIHQLASMSVTDEWVITGRATNAVQPVLTPTKMLYFCAYDEWHIKKVPSFLVRLASYCLP